MRKYTSNAPLYDYIIIGGGSAGCVLANRLSANPNNKVCLLEAGPSDNTYWIRSCNPVNMLFLMNSKTYNWKYQTQAEAQPETHTKTQNGTRRFFWPRGKCLGGSSSINAMIYTRGHAWDYDHWASLGNEGWDYQSVLPWFLKSQRQQRGNSQYHSAHGTMDVVDTNYHFPASEAFIKACEQAGHIITDDFNGAKQEGCGFFQVTQTPEGKRANSVVSFLEEAMPRSNLDIITHARVARILFEDKTACGVEYHDENHGKQLNTLRAGKEIILSAGVINSPHILKLSGIGNPNELARFNIPVVQALKGVGENLQDHPDVMFRCLDKSRTSFSTTPGPNTFSFIRRYFSNKPPFIYTPTDCGGFIKSDPSQTIPDLQLQFAAVRMQPHGKGLFTSSRFGYVLHVCHLRPKSRGKVLLNSHNPFDNPIIKANYFEDDTELTALVNGMKIGRELLQQPAMQDFHQHEEVPSQAVQTDEQWRDFIRQHVETVYHTAGTCKMGIDAQAVVNPQLQVHGVKHLRVIDSSIMPTITGSNIHAPTVMIAERGAEMILQNTAHPTLRS